MKPEMCIECHERPVYIKKRSLCSRCYQALKQKESRMAHRQFEDLSYRTQTKIIHAREIEFIKNYFHHTNWVYQPTLFRLNGLHYSPDFYDAKRNVFIEVAGTRQAYHKNKEKYKAFQEAFPLIIFEIRKSDGLLLSEDTKQKDWPK